MRGRPSFLLFMVVFYAASVLVQWAMWRWLRAVAPSLTQRYRRAVLAVLITMFLLPTARELAFLLPNAPRAAGLSILPTVLAIGMIWQLTVWMAMAAIGAGWLARWLVRAIGRRFQPTLAPALDAGFGLALGPAPDPVLDPRSVTPPSLIGRRMAIERLGGAAAFAVSGTTLGWGALRGRFEWAIQEVPIRLAKLPKALDGFTILQISDLHVGTYVRERELALGLGLIQDAHPDLIVITGDIVDSDAEYVDLAARHLGSLSARHGLVCIPGNHDYYTGIDAVLGGMTRAGIDVLRNRGKVVAARDGGGFALLGVDDLWARDTRRGPGPNLALAQSMVSRDLASILLAHQPRFVPTARAAGIDLQLSGHTHGGQINPGFRPADLLMTYVAGHYDVGSTQLYVNRGFGTVGPPSRVGAPPEITKIVLIAG